MQMFVFQSNPVEREFKLERDDKGQPSRLTLTVPNAFKEQTFYYQFGIKPLQTLNHRRFQGDECLNDREFSKYKDNPSREMMEFKFLALFLATKGAAGMTDSARKKIVERICDESLVDMGHINNLARKLNPANETPNTRDSTQGALKR